MAGIKNEQLSAEFVEEAYKSESSRAIKHLLEVSIRESANGDYTVYRYVDDYVPLEFQEAGQTAPDLYQPVSFKMSLGKNDAESTPQVSIDIDPGDRSLVRRLRKSYGEVYFKVSLVMVPQGAVQSVVTHREWGPVEMVLDSFDFKASSVSLKLKTETFLAEPAPSSVMNSTIAPALFQNKEI